MTSLVPRAVQAQLDQRTTLVTLEAAYLRAVVRVLTLLEESNALTATTPFEERTRVGREYDLAMEHLASWGEGDGV